MQPLPRLSARTSVWYKRVFPLLWFGILAIIVIGAIAGGLARRNPLVLLGPCVMAAFGYFLMKNLMWDLVDEVYDGGDHLIVRNGPLQERVALANIMNVSATTLGNPPRLTLRLVTPGKFGAEIAFIPRTSYSFNVFRRNAIADALIVRAYEARTLRPESTPASR